MSQCTKNFNFEEIQLARKVLKFKIENFAAPIILWNLISQRFFLFTALLKEIRFKIDFEGSGRFI